MDDIKSLLVQYKMKILGGVIFNVKHVPFKVKFVLFKCGFKSRSSPTLTAQLLNRRGYLRHRDDHGENYVEGFYL